LFVFIDVHGHISEFKELLRNSSFCRGSDGPLQHVMQAMNLVRPD
jgi:hypothetical protein